MNRAVALLCGVMAAGAPAAAAAQGSPVPVALGGGLSAPLAGTRAAMGDGWTVSVGATIPVTDSLGVNVGYLYSRFASEEIGAQFFLPSQSAPGATLPATVSGKAQAHVGSIDLVYERPVRAGRSVIYVLAGPSVFHRRVTLTGNGQGQTKFCEPQWIQCAAEAVPFDQAMGVRNATDLGFNAGAGVTFDVGLKARLFVEARFFWVRGREFQTASGPERASAQFLPITAGLRF